MKKTGLILTWVCLGWLSFIELVTTLWNKEEMSSLISSFIEPLKTFTEFYLTTFWYFSFPALLLNPSLIQLKTRKFLERSPSNLGVKPVINSRKWLTKCCNRRAEMKSACHCIQCRILSATSKLQFRIKIFVNFGFCVQISSVDWFFVLYHISVHQTHNVKLISYGYGWLAAPSRPVAVRVISGILHFTF